ncbi:putative NBD/HSP70 family sugar kinase [Lachnotalea glycerini]|uniref:Putative NBD/HSP70 family sugar kinase n=1 Tax=Lachnotalea glycerini TaxID=1763509 RepID=A0A318EN23_9FIRM|nr:ROK family transcriptional regulator [Lachnotalea glycerini]PXV86637.1 putative NBD/HSP70 family sugar kinase [Lachnotalea glycerini]
MMVGSQELIRDMNTTLVTKMIIDKGPISRAAIAKELGLTKATISAIVQNLLDKNLIEEIGTANVTSGRKPVMLKFNYECAYSISIDVSATHISVLSAHLGGGNCCLFQYPTANQRDRIIPELIQCIETQKKHIPLSHYGIVGITLGIHGITNNNQVIFTPYSPYTDIDFVTELEKHFQIPVLMENEANLSVLGEFTFHYPINNMVGVSVHSGIGLGIMIDGKLYHGLNGYAGEFGHSIIELDGRPCPCGNNGCFEQYASERALLSEFAKLKKVSQISADDFVKYYTNLDGDSMHIASLFVKYMSIGIRNIINTLNPELIVVNSSFTMNFPSLIEQIQASVTSNIHKSCNIVPSKLQDMSILLGGICMSRNKFLF